ncbi:MAG: AmmeMemoRadiSam system protein B [Bacteroidota bacterium]|nr:AmmeMemoRadiSam system protein B [Bacteroidota bacterium]
MPSGEHRDSRIPPLRQGLEVIPLEDDEGNAFFLIRDPLGYCSETVPLSDVAWGVAQLFDGRSTAKDLHAFLAERIHIRIPVEHIRRLADILDEMLLLDSGAFETVRQDVEARFLASSVRPAVHAGTSYPDEPKELAAFLSELFAQHTTVEPRQAPVGVIAPHIDLQIGARSYVPAYAALQTASFDTVVVLGTSHYSMDDLFILTAKDFETPLGVMPTDREFVEMLHDASGGTFTRCDTAHRVEHSIEFQCVFLRYLFGEKPVRMVPVLCTTFDHLFEGGRSPFDDPRFQAFARAFHETAGRLHRRVAFVLSVDWSHVGLKFDDEVPASQLLPRTREIDFSHFDALERGDIARFHQLVLSAGNETNIDGLSCVTTFFALARPDFGALLSYDQWHEEERESGVTYASMAFYRR